MMSNLYIIGQILTFISYIVFLDIKIFKKQKATFNWRQY